MSALMIATFTVKDPDKFAEYAAKAKPTWSSLGAEALYRGRPKKVLTVHRSASLCWRPV